MFFLRAFITVYYYSASLLAYPIPTALYEKVA